MLQVSLDPAEKKKLIEELKKRSRRSYLEIREEQQLDLFKRRLDLEDKLF